MTFYAAIVLDQDVCSDEWSFGNHKSEHTCAMNISGINLVHCAMGMRMLPNQPQWLAQSFILMGIV